MDSGTDQTGVHWLFAFSAYKYGFKLNAPGTQDLAWNQPHFSTGKSTMTESFCLPRGPNHMKTQKWTR